MQSSCVLPSCEPRRPMASASLAVACLRSHAVSPNPKSNGLHEGLNDDTPSDRWNVVVEGARSVLVKLKDLHSIGGRPLDVAAGTLSMLIKHVVIQCETTHKEMIPVETMRLTTRDTASQVSGSNIWRTVQSVRLSLTTNQCFNLCCYGRNCWLRG